MKLTLACVSLAILLGACGLNAPPPPSPAGDGSASHGTRGGTSGRQFWVSVSIFPLQHGEPRRFELEWIEPAASEAGVLQYRVPTVVNEDRVVGRPSLEVDGRPLALAGRDVVALPPAAPGAGQMVAGHAPGDPFHRPLGRAAPATGAPHAVMVAETSAAMTTGDRVRQRSAIEAILGALPTTSKVTLVAADWEVSVVADEVDPAGARRALGKLDGIASAGALHLERALTDAAARAERDTTTAVLFVGRGVDGFAGDAVHGPLGHLRDAGVRLSVVATGDVPASLEDAAALTGGEALRAATLGTILGALLDALQARPSPPTLAARGLDWRALETVTGWDARSRFPRFATRCGARRRLGRRSGPAAALGLRAPGLVGGPGCSPNGRPPCRPRPPRSSAAWAPRPTRSRCWRSPSGDGDAQLAGM